MGAKFTALKGTPTYTIACEKDADCYVGLTSASIAAATTTAAKAKMCCIYT